MQFLGRRPQTKVIVTSKSTSVCVYVESCLLQLMFRFEYTRIHSINRLTVMKNVALNKRTPGPNFNLMFKLHEIRSIGSQENH